MSRRFVPANPRSINDIETLALRIIQKYQPEVLSNGMPFDIERFFDCDLEDFCDVKSDYRELQYGIYGFTDTDQMECVISLDLAQDPGNVRFYRSTLAHEVGHALMHVRDYRTKKQMLKFIHEKEHLRAYREEKIVTYRNPEWQAWRFAGAILMPEEVFRDAVFRGDNVQILAKRFNVNPAFIRSRLRALKLRIKTNRVH